MRFSIYQESKKGGRKNNQDRMGYCYTREALLMVVADGMGGHLNGEVAAQIAVQTLGTRFQKEAQPKISNPQRFLEDSILDAHREIHQYRVLNQLPESPRTTIVACIVQNGSALWAHVGDSRLYWLRSGTVVSQTRDHTKLQSMVMHGKASPTELQNHPDRNKVFNCLGSPSDPMVELSRKATLKRGDSLFLCSDGLWSAVSDKNIVDAFSSKTVMRAVPDLIAQALQEHGSHADNVTGMAMTWDGTELGDEASGISTLLLPVGAINSTIQLPNLPAENQDDLSDDEIERAIEEIRTSISQTTHSKS